jgi:hypothetical protein
VLYFCGMKIKEYGNTELLGFDVEKVDERIKEMLSKPRPELHPELKLILNQSGNRQSNQ